MTRRTIVALEPIGSQITLKLDSAPLAVPGLGDQMLIDLSTLAGNTLIERGQAVFTLLDQHEPIHLSLLSTLGMPVNTPLSPLYFHIRARAADSVPWETLYHTPGGFCALDPGLPIGRIAASRQQVAPRPFTSPLRIVAVLSAARRSGKRQVAALQAAVAAAGATALNVHLHVISGEQEVLDAAAGPHVTTELIATDQPALSRQITAAAPHILHVLCHGGVVGGERTLSFAHFGDVEADAEHGSVRMSARQLAAAVLPGDPWLIVLSACDTAEATSGEDGPALANNVVSAGVPAVIGMRRLVDLSAANQFCEALYPELLAVVATVLTPAPRPEVRVVDWAAALTNPRRVLGGADPSLGDAWTDPVLYVQDEVLQVFLPSARLGPDEFAKLSAKIDTFRRLRGRLDPLTTDPAVIADLDARITELEDDLAQAGVQ
jgi:hypothetical protein